MTDACFDDISNTHSSYRSLSPSCQLRVDGGLDIAFKVDGRGEGDVWGHVRCTIDKFLYSHGVANFGGALAAGVARVRLAGVGSILGADAAVSFTRMPSLVQQVGQALNNFIIRCHLTNINHYTSLDNRVVYFC